MNLWCWRCKKTGNTLTEGILYESKFCQEVFDPILATCFSPFFVPQWVSPFYFRHSDIRHTVIGFAGEHWLNGRRITFLGAFYRMNEVHVGLNP